MDILHNGAITLHHGDCLDVMRDIPDNSIDLIATDPPYFKVKKEQWDRQWDSPVMFIRWLDTIAAQWQRILKPNGSLYCFASPRMAARVEVMLGDVFNVLGSITWAKPDPSSLINYGAGNGGRISKEALRSYYPNTERIIFCEHYGADNIAKGEAGYGAKCDELRGFVFEPLRAYLDEERQRAGLTPDQVNLICGFREKGGMAGRHWFKSSQFAMPTRKSYIAVQEKTGLFQREYEALRTEYEALRTEYEALRTEYEALRRPFVVTANVPYTDVWTFPTVSTYKGKHPCEKPLAMMQHIITASTRPDAVVLDCFTGGNTTGVAALTTKRRFIGIERDATYYALGVQRVQTAIDNLPPMDV